MAALLLAVMMMCSTALCSETASRSSLYLSAYRAGLTPIGGGEIVVTVVVDALGNMDKVGASKIYVYESSDGISFSKSDTFLYEDYPDMMGSGWDHIEDVVTFDATPGYRYFAYVYCYAENSTGSDEKVYCTSTVTAR